MPIIRDYETTEVLTIVGSITAQLPVHDTNDLLLVFVSKDTTTGTAPSTPAGWTPGASSSAGTAARGTWFYKIAASASETNPQSTSSDTDEWHAVAISIKNVDTTTPINTSATAASDNTMPWAGTTVTTTSDNCLVFHGLFCDAGNAPAAYPAGGVMNLSNQDAGTVSMGVAWEFKRTAGTTTARNWYGRTNDDARIFTVAVNDDGNNTEVPGYLDPNTSSCTLIHGFQGTSDNPTGNTYPASTVISPIGGITHSYVAATAVNDTGVNPYQTSTNLASTGTTATTGFRVTLASALALTDGYLLGTYNFSTPRELIDLGKYSVSGMMFIASDASNDYKAWMIGAKDSVTTIPDARVNYAIQIDQTTATTFANSGTLNDITNIQLSARMSTGTLACNFNMLVLVNIIHVAGGTSAYPLDFEDLFDIANTNLIPMMQRRGASDALCWAPFQIGGGNDPVHINVDLRYFQFPEAFSASEKRLDWHIDPNQVGFDFYGVSGDTIIFTNSTFASQTSYYWTINASASSGATWDFSGTTVVNAAVTLRNVMTFDSMSFVGCSSIDISSCTINNCNVSGAPAAGAGLTVNSSSTITNCEINTITVSAGNSFMSTATPEDISGTVFAGSTSTGHAIRLTATGTFSFSGNSFDNYGPTRRTFNTGTGVNSSTDVITLDGNHGYNNGAAIYYQKQGGTASISGSIADSGLYYVRSIASDQIALYASAANAIADSARFNLTSTGSETHEINSSSAAIYNNSGGLVTINISGGGDTPTYRNGTGSSTIINNVVPLEINGVVQNTQCYIAPSAGGSALMNEAASTLVSGNEYKASEDYNYVSDTSVIIRAREMGYLPFESTGLVTSAGLSITAVWLVDSNFKLVVSGISITFNENSPSADTIVRASGNFATDGWIGTMSQVTVEGSSSNDGTYEIASIATDTITLAATEDLDAVTDLSGVTLTFTRRSLT